MNHGKIKKTFFVKWTRLPEELKDSFCEMYEWRFHNDVDYVLDVASVGVDEDDIMSEITSWPEEHRCTIEEYLEDNWDMGFALELKKIYPEAFEEGFDKIVVEVCW